MPKAVLDTDPRTEADHIGYLRFEAPDGRIDVIMVTDGPSFEKYPDRPKYSKCPVWHIDFLANAAGSVGRIAVSPSIDIKDRYHTTTPVYFDIVDELPNESGGWDKRLG